MSTIDATGDDTFKSAINSAECATILFSVSSALYSAIDEAVLSTLYAAII